MGNRFGGFAAWMYDNIRWRQFLGRHGDPRSAGHELQALLDAEERERERRYRQSDEIIAGAAAVLRADRLDWFASWRVPQANDEPEPKIAKGDTER